VGGACALAAAEGAALNVRINLPSVTDEEAVKRFASSMDTSLRRVRDLAEVVRSAVDDVLKQSEG
jgi:formiminotetrahydrofolate cyclodeaminase